jgi:hypothetical protein
MYNAAAMEPLQSSNSSNLTARKPPCTRRIPSWAAPSISATCIAAASGSWNSLVLTSLAVVATAYYLASHLWPEPLTFAPAPARPQPHVPSPPPPARVAKDADIADAIAFARVRGF